MARQEQFEIQEKSSLHNCRTELPNIILDMKLTPYELSLYVHLKRIAGDQGKCYATNKYLSNATQMCVDKLNKVKKSLESKNLITIRVRQNEDGSFKPSLIQIKDCWPKNFEYFGLDKEKRKEELKKFLVPREKVGVSADKSDGNRLTSSTLCVDNADVQEDLLKEDPNKEKKEIYKEKSTHSKEALNLLNMFVETLKKYSPELKREASKSEATYFEELLKRGYKEGEIIKCIEFALKPGFWQQYTLTPSYFKTKFEKFIKAINTPPSVADHRKGSKLAFEKEKDTWKPNSIKV